MLIVPYAPLHLHRLALQPHQQHLNIALRKHGWAEQVAEAGPCWTALADDEPIACAGFQECWPGRAVAWAILSEKAGRHMHALTRAVRRALDAHPAARIEAQALVDFPPAMRWTRLLGFAPETVLRNFHRGRDYQSYVYFKDGAGNPSIVHESIDRQSRGIGDDNVDQHNDPEERAAEIESGEQVHGDRCHRNENENPHSARNEITDQEAGGEREDVIHSGDLNEYSTPTCAPSLGPKAPDDKRGMQPQRQRGAA